MNEPIMLATGTKLKGERWYIRLLRDKDGNERRVQIDLEKPRVRVRYESTGGEAA